MSIDKDDSKEFSRVVSDRSGVSTDGSSFRRSASPDDEDIEIVNYQDYLSLNVNLYDFSQVIFLEVKETYVPGENVECKYKVTNALYPNVRDRVCLFRLGWISPQDYKTYMWAKCPDDYEAGTVFDSQITFSAAFVPQESSENYYQFCYINHQDQIRGASTPFQFKEAETDESLPNVSISSQLIEELNEKVECLNMERESLMRENSEREVAMRECRKKIEMLERQLEDHEELVAVESQQSAEIERLNQKVNKLTKDFEQKQRDKDAQMTHYELVLERNKAAELEHGEMYKTLVKQAANLQNEKTEIANERTVLISEKEELLKEYQHLEAGNLKLVKQLSDLNDEYSDLLKLFDARESDVENLRSKLSEAESTSQNLMKELETQRQQINECLAQECLAQRQQIPDQLAGPVYALKKALDHTQAKLEQANANQDKLKADIEFYKKQLASKNDEIKGEKAFSGDLLVRLDMAKLSYKMKYVEAGRYRRELKNVLKQDKQLFRRVADDIEQQVKGIEAEWKVPPTNTDTNEQESRKQQILAAGATRDASVRGLSFCNESSMEEFFNERMVTAIEGGGDAVNDDESMSACTDSVYMDATPSNVPAEAEANGHEVTPQKEKNTADGVGEEGAAAAVTPTQTTVDSQMEGSALWKETHDKLHKQLNSFTLWKLNDLCLITCMDNLDRLAYIVDMDKLNRTVAVKVAYQVPKSLAASMTEENSISSTSSSPKVDWTTHLELETAPFDRIRPYKGEQVPRDVWLAICESLFSGGLSQMPSESSTVSDMSLPVASSTFSSVEAVKPKPTLKSLAADVASPEGNTNDDATASGGPTGPAPSIGGVGWGAFGPARMTVPLKNMISTGAGAAVDLVGGLASSVAIVSNGVGGSATATVVGSDARSTSQTSGSEKARDWMNSLGGRSTQSLSQSSVWPNKHLVEQPTIDPRRADDSTNSSSGFEDLRTEDEGSNQCLLCEKTFPRDVSPEVFNTHMEEHYGPSCPFCNLRFPKTKVGERELNNHVNAHLAEMGDM